MKVFKKDGMLTKPAEKRVRTERLMLSAHQFSMLFNARRYEFRFIYDGAIYWRDYYVTEGRNLLRGEWTLCANPQQGDTL